MHPLMQRRSPNQFRIERDHVSTPGNESIGGPVTSIFLRWMHQPYARFCDLIQSFVPGRDIASNCDAMFDVRQFFDFRFREEPFTR